eukprot:TRINITY_DN27035_c0_g2_i1.p1 TRINITY_DN27035_c0_g2~~TRINITY_DN27035_c0_g2_i1.p1  ORF type:complete len:349 (+),score=85.23 TRINITY_DN27035_c0_g2_i1:191-1237(+)
MPLFDAISWLSDQLQAWTSRANAFNGMIHNITIAATEWKKEYDKGRDRVRLVNSPIFQSIIGPWIILALAWLFSDFLIGPTFGNVGILRIICFWEIVRKVLFKNLPFIGGLLHGFAMHITDDPNQSAPTYVISGIMVIIAVGIQVVVFLYFGNKICPPLGAHLKGITMILANYTESSAESLMEGFKLWIGRSIIILSLYVLFCAISKPSWLKVFMFKKIREKLVEFAIALLLAKGMAKTMTPKIKRLLLEMYEREELSNAEDVDDDEIIDAVMNIEQNEDYDNDNDIRSSVIPTTSSSVNQQRMAFDALVNERRNNNSSHQTHHHESLNNNSNHNNNSDDSDDDYIDA